MVFGPNALVITEPKVVWDTTLVPPNYRHETPDTGGVTRDVIDGKIVLYGQATGTRRYVMFNGINAAKTNVGNFVQVLSPGIYRFRYKYSGAFGGRPLSATYSTFGNANDTFDINDGDIVTITKDCMIGIHSYADGNNNDNYGTASNPTTIEVAAYPLLYIKNRLNSLNFYQKNTLKEPGEVSLSGYDHQAFPDVEYVDGKLVIVSRVSKSHYTPISESDWGGIEIDVMYNTGKVAFSKLITKADFTKEDFPSAQGEVRGGHIANTKYGIFLVCWTTYNWSSHECIIARLNSAFSVVNYKIISFAQTGLPSNISFTQRPLITPTGHIIICGYRSDNVYICRSNESLNNPEEYTGNVEDLTFTLYPVSISAQATLQDLSDDDSDLDEDVVAVSGNECSLCYNKHTNMLYMLIRNSTSNQSSILIGTTNLEATGTWEIIKAYLKKPNEDNPVADGVNTIIHMPQLLPYQDSQYLVFVGANYRSASKRNFIVGTIDLESESVKMNIYKIDDEVNYGGYGGIVQINADEYAVAYYSEATLDNNTTFQEDRFTNSGTLATGYEGEYFNTANHTIVTGSLRYYPAHIPRRTGLYYRRINLRTIFPYIYHPMIEVTS